MRWPAALVVVLLAASCYTVPQSTLAQRYHSIYIPTLANETFDPQLHSRVTHALRREFHNDGQLRVVNTEEAADLVLIGRLTGFETRVTSFDDEDRPRRFEVAIVGTVVVREATSGDVVWQKNITADDFFQTREVLGGRPRDEGLNEAAEEFAERVVFDLVDSAW